MTEWFGLAAELVDLIGEPATLKLLAARGGTEITIPQRIDGSQLAGIVGHDAAMRMAEHFGAGKLVLPTGSARGAGGRRAEAMRLLRRGHSLREVALACGLHTRTITNYRRQLRADDDARQARWEF